MKEAFEKIIERLEKVRDEREFVAEHTLDVFPDGQVPGLEKAIEIVNQVAEEYNQGWIPCSVGLPKAHIEVWITYKWDDGSIHVDRDRVMHGEWYCTKREAVIAWQYMKVPEPYKPKGEEQWEKQY